MPKFLVVDAYTGDNDLVYDTMEGVLEYFKENEVDQRSYVGDRPTVYEIVKEVKIEYRPAYFVSPENETEIPAPLPGETVTQYAARITRG